MPVGYPVSLGQDNALTAGDIIGGVVSTGGPYAPIGGATGAGGTAFGTTMRGGSTGMMDDCAGMAEGAAE